MIRNQGKDERHKILNWFSKPNFRSKQLDVFSCAEPSTGEWLLNSRTFESWVTGDVRTLWCYGNRLSSTVKLLTVRQLELVKPL
jgi:hypothetical protein